MHCISLHSKYKTIVFYNIDNLLDIIVVYGFNFRVGDKETPNI